MSDDDSNAERDAGGPPRRRRRKRPDPLQTLDKSTIAIPLLRRLRREERRAERRAAAGLPPRPPQLHPILVDLNLAYHDGRDGAKDHVLWLIAGLAAEGRHAVVARQKTALLDQYVVATLDGEAIRELARRDNPLDREPTPPPLVGDSAMGGGGPAPPQPGVAMRAIYRIWPDFATEMHLTKSLATVKADAARTAFAAAGEDVVWAVIDSGIQAEHRHFRVHRNLVLRPPLAHYDFSHPNGTAETALQDGAGHGTHVAGIIAGEVPAPANPADAGDRPVAVTRHWNERGGVTFTPERIEAISGVAPKCKLVSFKVLDEKGKGLASNIIAAIAQIQELNGYGRHLLIHGVNLSVGYEFQPEWFACGQSPLCVEVDRLVRSGVVVVVSSGNTGYGFQTTKFEGTVASGMDLTINDPGNAELAITVGATHREMPHTYGVSYFSSKGPTGDGRMKPDLVAPGEKVISCAAGDPQRKANDQLAKTGAPGAADAAPAVPDDLAADAPPPPAPQAAVCEYVEQSGTSMAAPHVSGVIAAFLSVRREFLGQPEAVKRVFTSTATDLRRDRYFQGHGLIDLMRAIQSV
jgi:serine protease AprX